MEIAARYGIAVAGFGVESARASSASGTGGSPPFTRPSPVLDKVVAEARLIAARTGGRARRSDQAGKR